MCLRFPYVDMTAERSVFQDGTAWMKECCKKNKKSVGKIWREWWGWIIFAPASVPGGWPCQGRRRAEGVL